jgi:hypothetical protein
VAYGAHWAARLPALTSGDGLDETSNAI